MKIKDLDISNLDRKWFLIENYRELKRINKLFNFKKSKYPVVGYSYIDHECGISMRILGNIKYENKELVLDRRNIDEMVNILRYSEMEFLDVQEIETDVLRKIKYVDEVEEDMDRYYANESVLSLRKDNLLNPYRDPVFPDDVQFLIVSKDYPNGEIIWGRLEDKSDDRYIVSVIVEPNQDYGIRLGDLVELKYVEREVYKGLVFIKKHF